MSYPAFPFPGFFLVGVFLLAPAARAAEPALLDDFSDVALTGRGASRFVVDDKGMGSQSHATQRCADGVLVVAGELVPGRGLPAFISVPLLLAADGQPRDVSAYEGVRLRVKLIQGTLSVQVSTADIKNFDYHGAPVGAKRGEFVEVRVPFQAMKRAWSEQTAINLKVATSVNLVAFSLARDAFSYEIDEIGFY